jgi:hypothetical protein
MIEQWRVLAYNQLMNSKKANTPLLLVSLFLLAGAPTASAQSIEEIKAQIAALQEQIAVLQVQLLERTKGEVEIKKSETPSIETSKKTSSVTFSRDLSLGMSGEDVRLLQEILNKDARTALAQTGPGAAGNETDYFGPMTRNAVIRFQELYADIVLKPEGLEQGTGFVGKLTRTKLSALAGYNNSTQDVKSTQKDESSEAADSKEIQKDTNTKPLEPTKSNESAQQTTKDSTQKEDAVVTKDDDLSKLPEYQTYDGFAVGRADDYTGYPGQVVTIDGNLLDKETRILFDETVVTGTPDKDGKRLSFVVPDIKKGPYELRFESGEGERALRIMDFAIVFEDAVTPTLTSVSPEKGPKGTIITLEGKNFTSSGNRVTFNDVYVFDVPSENGTTLQVPVTTDIELPPKAELGGQEALMPLYVNVANENGFSDAVVLFYLTNE